jgi:hypothetical protein
MTNFKHRIIKWLIILGSIAIGFKSCFGTITDLSKPKPFETTPSDFRIVGFDATGKPELLQFNGKDQELGDYRFWLKQSDLTDLNSELIEEHNAGIKIESENKDVQTLHIHQGRGDHSHYYVYEVNRENHPKPTKYGSLTKANGLQGVIVWFKVTVPLLIIGLLGLRGWMFWSEKRKTSL